MHTNVSIMQPQPGLVGAPQLLGALRTTCLALDFLRFRALQTALHAHLARRANWTRAHARLRHAGRHEEDPELLALEARMRADDEVVEFLRRQFVRSSVARELSDQPGSSLMVEVIGPEGQPMNDVEVILSPTPNLEGAKAKMRGASRDEGVYAFPPHDSRGTPQRLYLHVRDADGRPLAVDDVPIEFEETLVHREIRVREEGTSTKKTAARRKTAAKKRTVTKKKTKSKKAKKTKRRTLAKKKKE